MQPLTDLTVNELLVQALKLSNVIGAGQIADAEDINDSFYALNRMLAMWNRKRWLVYVLQTFDLQSQNIQSYTVGPGGQFNTPMRPNRIESMYFRQVLGASPYTVDYPCSIIEAREDYNAISIKGLQSFPQYAFYESDWPLGTLYVWPIPPTYYQLFITVLAPLGGYTSLTQTLNLPPEYYDTILYNLAVRLCAMFGMSASKEVIGISKDYLSTLRRANAQVPLAKMPQDLLRRGIYNPYSDTNR